VPLVERIDRLKLEIVQGEGEKGHQIRHTPIARPDKLMISAKAQPTSTKANSIQLIQLLRPRNRVLGQHVSMRPNHH
jgi:hypothetical protein